MGESGFRQIGRLRSLWDVPGLRNLRKVCTKHGVHFIAIGGLVRNLIRIGPKWEYDPDYKMDVFDLVPFASDVDLLHTGPPEVTILLRRSLQNQIPFGECLRWQIRSLSENGMFWDSMKVNNIVPASTMTFSTNSEFGVHDRWNGATDYDSRQFRYIRNAYYAESPLYRAGKDLEVCSVLMYLRLLFEAGINVGEIARQPGWTDARQVIDDTCASTDALVVLQENAKLRARVRYLTAALRGVMIDEQVGATAELGLAILSEYLEGTVDLEEILYPEEVLTISAHLGGDIFRLPWSLPQWTKGMDAERTLRGLLDRVSVERDDEAGRLERVRLGPGQECLLVSAEPQPLYVGASASSRSSLGDVNEFVHFGVPAEVSQLQSWKEKYGVNGLAVLVAFELGEAQKGDVLIVPVPSAFSFGSDRLLIRINCGGLMELSRHRPSGGGGGAIEVWFVVVGWSGEWN